MDRLPPARGRASDRRRACRTARAGPRRCNEDGSVIGFELMNVRWTLPREGTLKLTWPQAELSAKQLDPVVAPRKAAAYENEAAKRRAESE